MISRIAYPRLSLTLALLAASACADDPTGAGAGAALEANRDGGQPRKALVSPRWNERSLALLALRPPGNGQAAASRMLTYLSLAQYRAVLAALDEKDTSVEAAVGGASVAVLSAFFPLDVAAIEAQLAADRAAGGGNQDGGRGEAMGRGVAATVVAQAAGDNYLVVSPGVPPIGPGYWVSNGTAIVHSLHGVRPFFLSSPDQLRPVPPPTFGSPEFLTDLAKVRAISDSRTPEQLRTAQLWNTSTAPFTAGTLNRIASGLIRERSRTELEATRILAYANAAAFDAQIACFDAKFAYWFIRPSQADPAITLPIGLPNHPSYPSGHSCITSAIMTVLIEAFPGQRARLEAIIREAGLSRVYGGIHYPFDIDAGQGIGRGAAALALTGSLE